MTGAPMRLVDIRVQWALRGLSESHKDAPSERSLAILLGRLRRWGLVWKPSKTTWQLGRAPKQLDLFEPQPESNDLSKVPLYIRRRIRSMRRRKELEASRDAA